MKLRCIRSFDKLFLKDKIYEAKGTKINKNEVFYNLKDENYKYGFVILNGLYWEFEIVKENEMKELTLQQAFECEVGTKFKVIYEDGSSPENKIELCKDENEIISFIWDDKDDAILTKDIMSAKFIPIVEKEVSFMEAIKAFDDGNTIKSVWGNAKIIYNGSNGIDLIDDCNNPIQSSEILEAKWYIID